MSDPLRPRWDLALVPCTAKKRVGADTALALYDGPRFQTMMLHAMPRADRVMIMSAKYGLLDLLDPVEYYDAYIPDLDAKQRRELIDRIWSQQVHTKIPDWPYVKQPERILSYLPKAYHELLVLAKPHWAPLMRRPYRNCTMFTIAAVLKNETQNYGKNPARR